MSDVSAPNPLDPDLRELIRRQARRVSRRPGFHAQDRAELEQELTVRLLERLDQFTPTRADRLAFVRLLLHHAAANLLRHRLAQCRDLRRTRRLGAALGDVPHEDALLQDAHDTRLGHTTREDVAGSDLACDVAEVLARLSPDQRCLAEGLMRMPLTVLARELGVPRSTVQAWVRRLREPFERAGLHDYL